MIPPLDNRGLLPPGVHRIDALDELPRRFCTNAHRWRLWDDVLAGLSEVCALLHQHPAPMTRLVMGGSFFSDKPTPADLEATLVFDAQTPGATCWQWTLQHVQQHARLKERYRLDFYPSLPGHNDFGALFQYVGPKTAALKGLDDKDPRGVIEVITW